MGQTRPTRRGGQTGIMIVSKCIVHYGKARKRAKMAHSCPVDRGGSEEMKTARSGLMRATQGHGNVWAAIGPHVWVHGPAATVVSFDVRTPDTIQGWQARAVQNWP